MSVVIGQADPAVDVPAVQDAVDAGGTVVLRGTFSFQGAIEPGPGPTGARVVLVRASVVIHGEDATIQGGGSAPLGGFQAVFLVDAPGHAIVLEGIRFLDPHNAAIRVVRSGALRIARCEVDGVIPTLIPTPGGPLRGALGIHLLGGGFGDVEILDNRLRIGASDGDSTGGININVRSGAATRVDITGNRVRETTAHGMDLRDVGGPARIEGNVIATGPVGRDGGPASFVDALRLVGSGEYRVLRNELESGARNAAVLRLAATVGAEVARNEITASMAAEATPGPESAGVQVRGSAAANEVRENRIRGRGRVGISVLHSDFDLDRPDGTDGDPVGNTFGANNFQQFDGSIADMEIGEGARNTTIVGGRGTLIDNGTGTKARGDFHSPTVGARRIP